MVATTDRHILRLLRVRVGFLELGDLKPGAFRPLTEKEIRRLKKSA
jgi:16S rRNA U516 pseudouridylate synthase RsuA-like enzyme